MSRWKYMRISYFLPKTYPLLGSESEKIKNTLNHYDINVTLRTSNSLEKFIENYETVIVVNKNQEYINPIEVIVRKYLHRNS